MDEQIQKTLAGVESSLEKFKAAQSITAETVKALETEAHKANAELRAQIKEVAEKGLANDAIKKEIVDGIKKDLVDHLAKAQEARNTLEIKRASLGGPVISFNDPIGKAYGGNAKSFVSAVLRGDIATLRAVADAEKAYGGQSETNADGGYAVPVELYNGIVALLRNTSKIMQYANIAPMSSKTRTIPKELTKGSVGWATEASTMSVSKMALTAVTQTAKKLYAVRQITRELLEDEAAMLPQFIIDTVGRDLANELDRVALIGDVDGTDPFDGLLNGSGVVPVSLAGASFEPLDLKNLIINASEAVSNGAVAMMNKTALYKCMGLTDLNGRDILDINENKIYGASYVINDNITNVLGTGAQTPIFFGNFKEALWISPRGEMRVDQSDTAADITNSVDGFHNDFKSLKFTQRMSIDVVNGAAMRYMLIDAA